MILEMQEKGVSVPPDVTEQLHLLKKELANIQHYFKFLTKLLAKKVLSSSHTPFYYPSEHFRFCSRIKKD